MATGTSGRVPIANQISQSGVYGQVTDQHCEADLSRSIAEKLPESSKGNAPTTFTAKRLTTRGTGQAGHNEQRDTGH